MKIHYTGAFKELDGNDVLLNNEPFDMGKWLGNKIASAPQEETITAIQRATTIYNNEPLELNIEQANKLISMIKNIKEAPSLFTAQLLQVIEDAKIGDKVAKGIKK